MPDLKLRSAMVVLVAVVLTAAVAGCGSSSGGSSETVSEGGGATVKADEGGTSAGDTATAAKIVAPYIGQPSAFPVTEKLNEVPKGATIAFMDCGTPICALFWELLEPAAQTMGVKLERIKAGSAADTVSAAFDTVVAKQPSAVIVPGISIELWSKQLKELQEAEIPVVTEGVTGTEPYGIVSPQGGENVSELGGELLANYVVSEMNPEANVVIYEVPELSFTTITAEKFTEELEAICPACSVRTSSISAEEIGNSAPSTVVSDLQANPDTNLAVFADDEAEIGLPTALNAAGIEIETLGNAPGPTNLQYIKEGKETAGFAADLAVGTWVLLDQAAREIIGQKLTGPEAEGIPVTQFLKQKDITFDPSKGWTGYPDFAERFAKLWGVEG